MGDSGGHRGGGDDPIPLAAMLPPPKSQVVPVAIAAFVGALVGAVVGGMM